MSRTSTIVVAVVVVVACAVVVLAGAPGPASSDVAPLPTPASESPSTMAPPSTTIVVNAPLSPVPAPTVRRPPIQRMSTDRHLYPTYLELRRSDRGDDLHVANGILFACYLATRIDGDLRTIAAGRSFRSDSKPPKPVRIDAARDVLSRCDGFGDTTRLELQQARADLRARLDRADDPVGRAEALLHRRRILSDELLQSILTSQDPLAINDVSAVLVERWRKTTKQPIASSDDSRMNAEVEGTVVMLLVYCDLGGDCARDGFEMTTSCALHADNCGVDQRARVLAQLPPDLRQSIDDRAATFVRAIQDDDFAFWGS